MHCESDIGIRVDHILIFAVFEDLEFTISNIMAFEIEMSELTENKSDRNRDLSFLRFVVFFLPAPFRLSEK